jgi:hypothetical protein
LLITVPWVGTGNHHSRIAFQDLGCGFGADTGILVEKALLTCGRCRKKELAIHNSNASLSCLHLVGKTWQSCVVEGGDGGYAEEARPQLKGMVKEASYKYSLFFNVAIVLILLARSFIIFIVVFVSRSFGFGNPQRAIFERAQVVVTPQSVVESGPAEFGVYSSYPRSSFRSGRL